MSKEEGGNVNVDFKRRQISGVSKIKGGVGHSGYPEVSKSTAILNGP